MIERALPVVSLLDFASQRMYRLAVRSLLRMAGVEVRGLPKWISPRAFLDIPSPGSMILGDEIVISHNVVLLTHDYSLDRVSHALGYNRAGEELVRLAPIVIDDFAFIGYGSILLPGVHVGRGAIVAAGSVVVHDVAANTVVGGNPARLLSSTSDFYRRRISDFEVRQPRP